VDTSRRAHPEGRRRHAITPALALAHADLEACEIEILDSERQTLEQPESRAVQQRRHEPAGTLELPQNGAHLVLREDDRKPARSSRSDDLGEHGSAHAQDFAIQEDECIQGLVLRRCGHAPIDSEMRQESLDLGSSKHARMTLLVEQDEPPNPLRVRMLRARAVVTEPNRNPDLVEEARARARFGRVIPVRESRQPRFRLSECSRQRTRRVSTRGNFDSRP
jgi:hypothetical protein